MNIALRMSSRNLTDLASESVHALWKRRVFTQQALATALGKPLSAVNRIVHGKQPVTLRVLEAVASLAGISPVEMLIDPSVELKAVNPMEAQLLRYYRSWPAPTRESLLSFASFFADEDPVTADERRAHEQIRRLGDGKRRLAYAYLTFLTEGDLPPDIRKGLGLPEVDAPLSTPPRKAKTPTKRRA